MKIPQEILNRKGGRARADVPKEVKSLLEAGKIQTINLMEWLVVDQLTLVKNLLNEADKSAIFPKLKNYITKEETTNSITQKIGKFFLEEGDENLFNYLSNHTSDFARVYATYYVGFDKKPIKKKLELIKKFAADTHFGVRETAWMAVRNGVIDELDTAIKTLTPWAKHKNENIRRFASEVTRPRGVWCKHISELRENPELALSIIEPLKGDEARYVQLSVGNWLNDASKTQPKWVQKITKQWLKESPTIATEKIVKRGLRTINKA